MIEASRKSDEPVAIIAVGAAPSLKVALERGPRIADDARFIGMCGSVYKGSGHGS